MHFIATCFPVFIDCAFSTSENAPSPFLDNNLYSIELLYTSQNNKMITVHFGLVPASFNIFIIFSILCDITFVVIIIITIIHASKKLLI